MAAAAARVQQGSAGLLADLGSLAAPPRVMATPLLGLLVEGITSAAWGGYSEPLAGDESMLALASAIRLLAAYVAVGGGGAYRDNISSSSTSSSHSSSTNASGSSGGTEKSGGGASLGESLSETRKALLRLIEGLLMQSDSPFLTASLSRLIGEWLRVPDRYNLGRVLSAFPAFLF